MQPTRQPLVEGLMTFDDKVVDGVVDGQAARRRGHVRHVPPVQTGYVRSYALSVLAGALLVVLALLAVNLA